MEILKRITENFRNAFRVKPDVDEPIYLAVNEQRYKVEDISATGFAIWDYPYKDAVELEAVIKIPGFPEVEAKIKLFDKRFDITVGSFVFMSPDDLLIIDKYVLERQKEEIRRKKKRV